ncbi:MAG: protease [Bacteroidales bacterium]|nr:protease [Bacteroidales bacterium]
MKKHLLSLLILMLPLFSSASDNQARLLRFPTIGGGKIVFSYAGDLYSVDADGGAATRLTSHVGYEVFPKISPDGKTIAFTGQYDGNTEVYSMPLEGGEPVRLTWTPTLDRDNMGDRMGPNNIVMNWTPDGSQIIFRTRWYTFSGLRGRLYQVPAHGGMPKQIPTTEGGFCSYSPDGKYLAMNRMFREFRTWKYYKGGQADDIWIHKVGTTSLEKITDNPSQDVFPMWIGDEIFYLSDRDRTMNMFVYNTKTKKSEKVTDFTEYDIKFPSASKDYIVFENGGYIYKFSVKDRTCTKVDITLSSDNIWSRTELGDASKRMSSYALSPDGERVLVTARGDIFSLPAKQGVTYNVTRSPGSHERNVVWSPDGTTIAYFSDADGEYQVYTAPSSDMSAAKIMTSFASGYLTGLQWSPDSRTLYFNSDKRDKYELDVATGALKRILVGTHSGIRSFTLTDDGSWAAYVTSLPNKVSAVFLYEVATGNSYQVTDKWYDSSSPVFSKDGKYLFFTSSRNFRSSYSRVEWNATYSVNDYVFVLPLAKETPNPAAVKSDEYSATGASELADKSGKPSDKRESKQSSAVKIDTDGLFERISPLPLPAGGYNLLFADGGKLYYISYSATRGSMARSDSFGVKSLDLKTMKSSDAFKGVPVSYTSDLKKALVRDAGKLYVINIAGPGKPGDPVPTSDMEILIDRQREWKQIFDESWRVMRDGFYVENMHGVDWEKIHSKYAQLLPYVKHRHDLSYIIGEMIGELNVGHAYINSGDVPELPRIKTGLLGAEFVKDKSGAFKIAKIFKGANWDESLRSPLSESDAKVGEYVLSVNGIPCSGLDNIYQALVGKADKVVSLVVSPDAKGAQARTIYVKTIPSESQLAYYEWVQTNIEKVEKASNGEIGYIHIPDMGTAGLDMFTKLFYTQLDKKALIIDDRMNGGGNVSPMILERLQRVVYRMSMSRNGGEPNTIPGEAHYGPKVCLIDKYSSSDGDLFPYGFKTLGLGKVIGMRSWGGIVGISGSKPYIDGQDMRVPFFTSYSSESGEWIIEGYGVDPDIVVDINPFEDYLGKDAQLDKAIEVLKEELKTFKPLPGIPADPVR